MLYCLNVLLTVDNVTFASAENRCVFHVVSSANYRYSRPARHVQTYIRLIPPPNRGLQRVVEQDLRVAPLSHGVVEGEDRWGNRVFEVRHEQVEEHLTLIAEIEVETACRYTDEGIVIPTPIAPRARLYSERRIFRETTDRTLPSADLERVAREMPVGDAENDPFAFAASLCAYVNDAMTFQSGSTHVATTAAEAWENRSGVCQDYTHITLCLFRLCGVPARYVSGFVPGEGVMHAWVEVMLSRDGGEAGLSDAAWYAIDPTYNKWVTERYLTVAVGRDYGDVTPTSGNYYGGSNTLQYGTRVDSVRSHTVLLQAG